MPKISDQQRQARRDQILAATWRCFLRKGIHATSMEEIIREANLSAGAVYLYYKSKDELIFAAISTYMAELRGLLMPILMKERRFHRWPSSTRSLQRLRSTRSEMASISMSSS
jgi:TetR/AcrR family transcriptional regulator, transcriptional repressor of aconitase